MCFWEVVVAPVKSPQSWIWSSHLTGVGFWESHIPNAVTVWFDGNARAVAGQAVWRRIGRLVYDRVDGGAVRCVATIEEEGLSIRCCLLRKEGFWSFIATPFITDGSVGDGDGWSFWFHMKWRNIVVQTSGWCVVLGKGYKWLQSVGVTISPFSYLTGRCLCPHFPLSTESCVTALLLIQSLDGSGGKVEKLHFTTFCTNVLQNTVRRIKRIVWKTVLCIKWEMPKVRGIWVFEGLHSKRDRWQIKDEFWESVQKPPYGGKRSIRWMFQVRMGSCS